MNCNIERLPDVTIYSQSDVCFNNLTTKIINWLLATKCGSIIKFILVKKKCNKLVEIVKEVYITRM